MEKPALNRFSSLSLNPQVSLKNRIVVSPMASQTATEHGFATQKTIEHYARLSRSGAGLVMGEYTFVHLSGRSEENQLGISTDGQLNGLAELAQVIRRSGAVAGIQLTHSGAKSSRKLSAGSLMGPSSLAVPVRGQALEVPDPMSREQIELWKKSFIEGAERAVLAGFDVIELHSAHGYGLNQWLSSLTNQRNDEYGGCLENRARLLLEVVSGIRSRLPSVVLSVRIPGQDLLEGGLSVEEMIQVSRWLEAAGVNILNVSSGLGGWRRPIERRGEGYLVPEAMRIQSEVSIPVMGVGGIESAEFIDQIIGEGAIRLAAVGRAILDDPDGFRRRIFKISGKHDESPEPKNRYLI